MVRSSRAVGAVAAFDSPGMVVVEPSLHGIAVPVHTFSQMAFVHVATLLLLLLLLLAAAAVAGVVVVGKVMRMRPLQGPSSALLLMAAKRAKEAATFPAGVLVLLLLLPLVAPVVPVLATTELVQ